MSATSINSAHLFKTTSSTGKRTPLDYFDRCSYSSLSQGHFSRKIEQHSPVKYTARLFWFFDLLWQEVKPTPLPFYTQTEWPVCSLSFQARHTGSRHGSLSLPFNNATRILLFHRRVNEFATLNPETWLLSQYPIRTWQQFMLYRVGKESLKTQNPVPKFRVGYITLNLGYSSLLGKTTLLMSAIVTILLALYLHCLLYDYL